MNDLNKKLDDLKKEYEIKRENLLLEYNLTESLNVKTLFVGNIFKHVYIDLTEDHSKLNEILSIVPSSKDLFKVGSIVVNSPFQLILTNRCKESRKMNITYSSENQKITIKVPILSKLVEDGIIRESTRKLTPSEYIYFPGKGAREIGRINIDTYFWNTTNKIIWNQGDSILLNEDLIDKVINMYI